MRKCIITIMTFPIAITLWLIGWALFYLGFHFSKKRSDKTPIPSGKEEIKIAEPLEEALSNP